MTWLALLAQLLTVRQARAQSPLQPWLKQIFAGMEGQLSLDQGLSTVFLASVLLLRLFPGAVAAHRLVRSEGGCSAPGGTDVQDLPAWLAHQTQRLRVPSQWVPWASWVLDKAERPCTFRSRWSSPVDHSGQGSWPRMLGQLCVCASPRDRTVGLSAWCCALSHNVIQ